MNLLKGKPFLFKGNHLKTILFWSLFKFACVHFCFFFRHVSEYLKIQERDPKAHKFLGQLFEKEGEVDKAVGCYKVFNHVYCSHLQCFHC